MGNKAGWLALVVAVVILGGATYLWLVVWPQQRTYIASGHPEWPPIMWQSGEEIVGVGPELTAKIFADLGLKVKFPAVGLWDEVQVQAKSGQVDLLVAAYKTEERETYLDYSETYTVDPVVLFVSAERPFTFAQWPDLVNKSGVATVGDSYGQEFDDYIEQNLSVARVKTVGEALDLVVSGGADYFLYALYSGEKALAAKGLTGKIVALPQPVTAEDFYLAIAKKSPLTKRLSEINLLLEKYRADGTIDELIKKYRQATN